MRNRFAKPLSDGDVSAKVGGISTAEELTTWDAVRDGAKVLLRTVLDLDQRGQRVTLTVDDYLRVAWHRSSAGHAELRSRVAPPRIALASRSRRRAAPPPRFRKFSGLCRVIGSISRAAYVAARAGRWPRRAAGRPAAMLSRLSGNL
jgi:hypothetical protein